MNDVSDVLAILNAGYEAQANKPARVSSGAVPVRVEGIEFDSIRDAVRGFSDELIENGNVYTLTTEEYEARDTTTAYLFVNNMYLYVNYSFVDAAKLFEGAGLSFERL
jgi:hypothetical protein